MTDCTLILVGWTMYLGLVGSLVYAGATLIYCGVQMVRLSRPAR